MATRFLRVFLAGYIFVIILALALGYFSQRALDKVEGDVVVLGHDHKVVTAFQDILIALGRAESNRRGYIITEDKQYLENYNDAVVSLQKSLQSLRVLAKNGRYQDAFLDSIESKIDRQVEVLQTSLQLAIRDTSADSIQVIFTDRGRESMKSVRSTIKLLLSERSNDRNVIYRNLDEYVSNVQSLYAVVIILMLCSLPAFAVVAYFQFRRVRITETALRQDLVLARQQVQRSTNRIQKLEGELGEKAKREGDVSSSV
jgi:CHASE3 domain sensor protein